MAIEVLPFRDDTSNVDVLNAIRNVGSNDYQRRVPEATKASIAETNRVLLTNAPLRNEFVSALVNQIGLIIARNNNWQNPFKKFKRGMLENGDTIEEVQIGLAQAYTYDTDRDYLEKVLFGQERPDAQSSFHKINRQNFYKITVNDAILRRAFLSSSGLADFISKLMEVPSTSDEWDEFLTMTQLFREYEDNGGFFHVNVPDVSATGSTAADAKAFLRRVRELADTLTFLSPHYNAAGMPVFASRDDLELFITPQANAAIDVEALAAAFNVDRAAVPSRQTIVPRERFNIPGCMAVLTTKDFFVVADSLFEMRQQNNPVGLYDNFYLHHHQIISTSRFVPAVMLTTGAGDVIEITDTPVTSVTIAVNDRDGVEATQLVRGSLYQIVGEAVTTPEGGFNSAVRLSIVGNVPISALTYVSQTGTLHIGPDEDATSITVTATATDNATQTASTTALPVVGDKLELWPNPRVLPDVDKDAKLEVTPIAVPAAPTTGTNKNKVTIPTPVEGYDYMDGTTIVNGSTITLTANKTITAVARTGYEIATGATSSWALVYTA